MDFVRMLQKVKFIWKVFGNDDDPYPPDWFLVGKKEWIRQVRWYLRNSFHNFFWYVVGCKRRKLDYTNIWNREQKWNLVLPFFSYRGKRWEFYIGWRPDTKALGLCLRKRG